jgi:diguanylate cyclase (GGDEF)-like protein/PAS domain S-box-containing protein
LSLETLSPDPPRGETDPLGWGIRIFGIALAIFVAAKLSQHLTTPPSNASPVWIGSGIALAVTILYGPRALIGIFLGAVAFEFQLFAETAGDRSLGNELMLASALGTGAALQAFVGAELIRRLIGSLPRLVRDMDILRFQLLGGPVACVVSATVGLSALWFLGIVAAEELPVSWLTWWVGDTIGAVIFAPLVLIFFNHRDPLWQGRKTTVALPMLLLLLTAIAFYSYSNIKEHEERQHKFYEQVRTYHNTLMREFENHLEILSALKSYFDASLEVSSEEFRIVTQTPRERRLSIQALEWIPRIRHSQRAEFERGLPAVGAIRQLDGKGGFKPADSAGEYYAIQYIQPAADNTMAYGFNVLSNPIAKEAITRARDTGDAAATRPLRLVQETANQVGIVVYNPVYRAAASPGDPGSRREAIIGVVALVLRMQNLIETVVPNIGQGMVELSLLDVTDGGSPHLLYTSHGDGERNLSKELVESRLFDMAGRRWKLEYSATPGFIAENTTWAVWVVLAGGLLITALLGTGLLMLTGRTLRREDEVIERTAELRAEVMQRRDTERQLRLVLEGANLGFWDWHYQTGEQWVNERWMEILGLERADLRNDASDWLDRIHPDDKPKVLQIIDEHIKRNQGYVVECRVRHRDGHWVWVQASGAVVSHDPQTHEPLRLCGTHQDITDRRQQEEHILHQAHFDSLTELPNRFLALDRLSQLINEARRNSDRVAVLFLDLDDFKKINDTLGHDTGDKLLKEAASRLHSVLRSGDTVGRLGGDEFIILLGGLADVADTRPVAEALLNEFTQAFRIDSRELVLTASIGIAIYPEDGDNLSELLRNADSAMYHSKEQGRNTYSYFTEEMNQGVSQRLLLEEQMHGALSRGEFRLCYQPKVELASGRIVGAEALLRWSNPVLGEVSPLEFIPIAEQTGLIVPIGKFVLDQALEKVVSWRSSFGDGFTMAINLSPRQFRDPNLVPYITDNIRKSGIAPASLELEITEGVLMSGYTYIDDALAALNELGVNIAMDDFGTGYSSLSYLRSYPFDVLKIDREFVSDITDDPADRELVNAAIAMAHGLGLKVVAEGVETEDQRKHLASQGCEYAQGYLFSKPLSADEMIPLFAQADSILLERS